MRTDRRSPSRRPPFGGVMLLGVVTLGACATAAVQDSERIAPDRGVALATVVVDNRTSRTLAIRFHYATHPSRSVEVGRVAPGRLEEVAPVPAQEPIVLTATGEGMERRLDPLTLEIDAVWTWVITDSVPDAS